MPDEYIYVDDAGNPITPAPRSIGQKTTQNMYSGMMDSRSDDLIKFLLDARQRTEEFIDVISGKQIDIETGEYKSNSETMVINERGCQYIKGVLRGFMIPDLFMTRYDDDEQIRKMSEPLAVDIKIDLNFNRISYGIPDSLKVSIICHQIENLMIATLRRGLKQGERSWLKGQASYVYETKEAPRKSGFFQGLLKGGR